MYVEPFWFGLTIGVLIGIVSVVVLALILSNDKKHREDENE